MFGIIYIITIFCMIILILAVKYLTLKRQLKKLTVQVMELSEGVTEKMLDISFIDRDLE